MIEQLAFGIDLNIDPLWCAWFSGLIDGEGCFCIHKKPIGFGISAHLEIRMRVDETPYLKMICNTLHCGTLSFSKDKRGGNYNPTSKISIASISDVVNIIIPILDRYPLRMKKQHDYKIWREAAMLIHLSAHLNSNRDRVLELKRMLSDVRKYRSPTEDELLQQPSD